jgi:hypothetical protein
MPQSDDNDSDSSHEIDSDQEEEDTPIKSRILTLLQKLIYLINDLPE